MGSAKPAHQNEFLEPDTDEFQASRKKKRLWMEGKSQGEKSGDNLCPDLCLDAYCKMRQVDILSLLLKHISIVLPCSHSNLSPLEERIIQSSACFWAMVLTHSHYMSYYKQTIQSRRTHGPAPAQLDPDELGRWTDKSKNEKGLTTQLKYNFISLWADVACCFQ